MKALKYKGISYACPFSDKFRRHSAAEAKELSESIAEHGILHPVRVYFDTTNNWHNCILDGEGRMEAAIAVGTKVPLHDCGRMTNEEAYSLACSLNDARRHDDAEAVKARKAARLVRVVEKNARGESTRKIAQDEGISQSQVLRDLADAGEPPGSPEPKPIKGRDGKTYKVKPKAAKPPKPEVPAKEDASPDHDVDEIDRNEEPAVVPELEDDAEDSTKDDIRSCITEMISLAFKHDLHDCAKHLQAAYDCLR